MMDRQFQILNYHGNNSVSCFFFFFYQFTIPSAVKLVSPWTNVKRDRYSCGSHAIYFMTISLHVLSTSCHSQVRNSQQLQQNSSTFSEFFFNTAKMIHWKPPMTSQLVTYSIHFWSATDFAFGFHHHWWQRRKWEVKSLFCQISSVIFFTYTVPATSGGKFHLLSNCVSRSVTEEKVLFPSPDLQHIAIALPSLVFGLQTCWVCKTTHCPGHY